MYRILALILAINLLHTPVATADVFFQGFMGLTQGSMAASMAATRCKWRMPAALFNRLTAKQKGEQIAQCVTEIHILDEISRSDGADFAELVGFFDSIDSRSHYRQFGVYHHTPGIKLDSPGGSIVSALAMAEAIRGSEAFMKVGFPTIVMTDDICHSACVAVLAASYRRMVFGKIGIHRPYFQGDEYLEWGYDDLQKAYDALYKELSDLFRRANLSRTLIDDMFAIPSSDLRILSEEELQNYGLSRNDAILEEQSNMRMRAICGKIYEVGDMSDSWKECLDKMNLASRDQRYKENTLAICGVALTYDELSQAENLNCANKIRVSNGLPPLEE